MIDSLSKVETIVVSSSESTNLNTPSFRENTHVVCRHVVRSTKQLVVGSRKHYVVAFNIALGKTHMSYVVMS